MEKKPADNNLSFMLFGIIKDLLIGYSGKNSPENYWLIIMDRTMCKHMSLFNTPNIPANHWKSKIRLWPALQKKAYHNAWKTFFAFISKQR